MEIFVIIVALLVFFVGYTLGGIMHQDTFPNENRIRKEFVNRLENQYGYIYVSGKIKGILQADIYDCLESYEEEI